MDNAELRDLIRDVPDFPKPGVVFKDITPVLGTPRAFEAVVGAMAGPFDAAAVDKVAGIEARGFILATPVADRLDAGFIPIRKPGKLPWSVVREEYDLEYGTDALEVHEDAVAKGDRVLLVDDVIATGGTAAAAARLLDRIGAEVVGMTVFVELGFLDGRSRLDSIPFHSLVRYD